LQCATKIIADGVNERNDCRHVARHHHLHRIKEYQDAVVYGNATSPSRSSSRSATASIRSGPAASIKWLDHLQVAPPGANTGKSIALGRLGSPLRERFRASRSL
jgi:hypothetical protein